VGLKMMNVKINIVLLGMMCIGLVVCSGIEKIDGEGFVFYPPNFEGTCTSNEECNNNCINIAHYRIGFCIQKNCCCRG